MALKQLKFCSNMNLQINWLPLFLQLFCIRVLEEKLGSSPQFVQPQKACVTYAHMFC